MIYDQALIQSSQINLSYQMCISTQVFPTIFLQKAIYVISSKFGKEKKPNNLLCPYPLTQSLVQLKIHNHLKDFQKNLPNATLLVSVALFV